MDVKFFPATTAIEVKVCNSLWDAKAIFVQNTDKPADERYLMELYGFLYNIQLTDNLNSTDGPITDFTPYLTGRCTPNLYHADDRWKNPITGVFEIIPDYYATAWTSAGAAVFDVGVGAVKSTRFPNHGQELFSVSSGRYGWDYINGIPGTNNGMELFSWIENELAYFKTNIGVVPSAFSYRNGQVGGSKMMMPYFLGGRNSDLIQADLAHSAKTNYGQSKDTGAYIGYPAGVTTREDRINSQSSSRYKDMVDGTVTGTWGTSAQILAYFGAQFGGLIAGGGGCWNDFIHRYQYGTPAERAKFGLMLGSFRASFGNNFVWCTSYGSAIEYLFYREMISRVVAFERNNQVNIVFEKTDPYKNNLNAGISEKILYNLLRVPISIRINLTGTYLAGKSITTNYGSVLSKGGNVYVIQIPYGNAFEGFGACVLSETATPTYINLNVPVITSSSRVGNVITINADQPTRAALFKAVTGADINTSTIYSRDNVLSTTHVFDITGATGNDFRCGLITETKQSILSQVV
jgi:hypothetical protein